MRLTWNERFYDLRLDTAPYSIQNVVDKRHYECVLFTDIYIHILLTSLAAATCYQWVYSYCVRGSDNGLLVSGAVVADCQYTEGWVSIRESINCLALATHPTYYAATNHLCKHTNLGRLIVLCRNNSIWKFVIIFASLSIQHYTSIIQRSYDTRKFEYSNSLQICNIDNAE